jgi:hypothetical protein
MELVWSGGEDEHVGAWNGRCRGFHIAQVLRNGPRGWRAYIAHVPVDGVDHPTAQEAMSVADAAVADRPDPQPGPSPERRRYVDNTGPADVPHPGEPRQ